MYLLPISGAESSIEGPFDNIGMYTNVLMEKIQAPWRNLLTFKELRKGKSARYLLFGFMGAKISSQRNKVRKQKKKA